MYMNPRHFVSAERGFEWKAAALPVQGIATFGIEPWFPEVESPAFATQVCLTTGVTKEHRSSSSTDYQIDPETGAFPCVRGVAVVKNWRGQPRAAAPT
jgi:hypothetical protein